MYWYFFFRTKVLCLFLADSPTYSHRLLVFIFAVDVGCGRVAVDMLIAAFSRLGVQRAQRHVLHECHQRMAVYIYCPHTSSRTSHKARLNTHACLYKYVDPPAHLWPVWRPIVP